MTSAIVNAVKTHRPTKQNFIRTWYVVDASKAPLGRVSTLIANLLTGKNRPDFAPDVDMGGCVVVLNSDKVVVTGKKAENKVYFRHTGHTGGIRHTTFAKQLEKDSSKIIYHAVSGMIPKNRHRDIRMNNRLHIIPDENYPTAQKLVPAN
jgi:large subunit ribosomal protein L13